MTSVASVGQAAPPELPSKVDHGLLDEIGGGALDGGVHGLPLRPGRRPGPLHEGGTKAGHHRNNLRNARNLCARVLNVPATAALLLFRNICGGARSTLTLRQ